MNIPSPIKEEIDQLILLMMTTGVQPSELADNIFLSSYKELKFYKNHNQIMADISFYQDETPVTLRYYYDNNKFVSKIESIVYETVSVEWDRNTNELELAKKILITLKKYYTNKQINKFIKTLPDKIQQQLKVQLLLSA